MVWDMRHRDGIVLAVSRWRYCVGGIALAVSMQAQVLQKMARAFKEAL